jgi:hypothetical protein
MTLPTTPNSFQPAIDRSWLVRFWQLEAKWVGIALPFGFVLFILFYFDANVSVSQASPYLCFLSHIILGSVLLCADYCA